MEKKEEKRLYSIGETAKIMGISVQMLRNYSNAGLLTPDSVDEESGYRYYSFRQFHYIDRIRYLRSLGMPLSDIQEVLTEGTVETMQKLLEKQRSGDEPTTVIRENKPIRNSMHPTMKPVPLLLRLIKNSSRRGEIVFDPFGGSGSTLIACEQADRVCYTMELDPKYVDVIVKRHMLVTGKDDVICIRDGRELSRREVSKLIQE